MPRLPSKHFACRLAITILCSTAFAYARNAKDGDGGDGVTASAAASEQPNGPSDPASGESEKPPAESDRLKTIQAAGQHLTATGRLQHFMKAGPGAFELSDQTSKAIAIVVISRVRLWKETSIPPDVARRLALQRAEYDAYAQAAFFAKAKQEKPDVVQRRSSSGYRLRRLSHNRIWKPHLLDSDSKDGNLTVAWLIVTNHNEDKDANRVSVEVEITDTLLRDASDHDASDQDVIAQEELITAIILNDVCVVRESTLVVTHGGAEGLLEEHSLVHQEQRTPKGALQYVLTISGSSADAVPQATGFWFDSKGRPMAIQKR